MLVVVQEIRLMLGIQSPGDSLVDAAKAGSRA